MFQITSFDPQASSDGTGIIKTQGINADEQFMMYNDSPCGLLLTFNDNNIDIIPAFWNKDFIIHRAMGNINWKIIYTLSNPTQYGISLNYGTIYEKEERVASQNNSINRGVVVTNQGGVPVTSSSSTLFNTGAASGTPIIEVSSAITAAYTAYLENEGLLTLGVTIAGAIVNYLKSNATDPILQLGALTHIVEILGNLTVDGNTITNGNETVTGILTANNASNTVRASSVPATGVTSGILPSGVTLPMSQVTAQSIAAANVAAGSLPSSVLLTSVAAAATLATSANALNSGANIPGAKLGRTSDGDMIDGGSTSLYLKGKGGGLIYQYSNGNTGWSRTSETHGTVSVAANGTSTITHGLKDATGTAVIPDAINITPNNTTSSTGTWTEFNRTSTTFQIFAYSYGQTFDWEAKRY